VSRKCSAGVAVLLSKTGAAMTNLETLLTTVLERLDNINLRLTELEIDAEQDRKREEAVLGWLPGNVPHMGRK
jgi:hypothetical protein